MIYLLRSPAWKKGSGYFQILKIGWTDDTVPWLKGKAKKRKRTYKSHNPTCEMLVEIPGFSKEVEEALHDKFSAHRYEGMKEWYFLSKEIIDFFSSPDVVTNLEGLKERGEEIVRNRQWKKDLARYNYFLSTWFPNISSFPKSNSKKEWWDEVDKLLKDEPTESLSQFKLQLDLIDSGVIPEEVKEAIQRISTIKSLPKRIEILKEYSQDLEENDFEILLNTIDSETLKEYERNI